MSFLGDFWHKICEPLDGFLWHKDISHPIIRTTLRNQILATAFCLLLGCAIYAAFPWLFWFGAGLAAMNWIFWSWARFFLKGSLKDGKLTFFRVFILNFGIRLLVLSALLYLALTWAHAPVGAILSGLATGTILALANYAIALRNSYNA